MDPKKMQLIVNPPKKKKLQLKLNYPEWAMENK